MEGAALGTPMSVVLDATTDDLPGIELVASGERADGRIVAVGGIPHGTHEGRAAVAIVTELPDGSTVVGQTTLALLRSATMALAARYPDGRAA